MTGPYIVIDAWDMLIAHTSPPGLEVWPNGQITSWIDNFFFYPHHTVALVCCLFGFLLAWMEKRGELAPTSHPDSRYWNVLRLRLRIIGLRRLRLCPRHAGVERMANRRRASSWPVVNLALGGVVAAVLLIPYLAELTHGTSRMHGSSVFAFSVRETISPAGLLTLPLMRSIATGHPVLATSIANFILLVPGYAVELGFYFVVLAIFFIALRRRGATLTSAQRALLIMALASFPFISFIRSEVLNVNDFGIHGGMFVELPLLLLASELVMSWRDAREVNVPVTPQWLISAARILGGLGILSTIYIAFMLRFGILVLPDTPDPQSLPTRLTSPPWATHTLMPPFPLRMSCNSTLPVLRRSGRTSTS